MATAAKPKLKIEPLDRPGFEAWRSFVFGNARLMRELDEELRREHGFSLGDFDVLAQLSLAPGEGLRMCDLASAVLLSPSGLSRRVERLERSGYVKRERAGSDGRSIEARLTAAGKRLLERLRATHFGGVRERFADQFSSAELETLHDLLGRLEGEDGR